MRFRIIPRSEWGATTYGPYTRAVGRLEKWLHHSVTVSPDTIAPYTDDYDAIRAIDRIGRQRFGRYAFPYTFAVTPAGLIFEGHPINRVGAHTSGRNTRSAGIVWVGNYENQKPTAAQIEATAWLLQEGKRRGWWGYAELDGGHRDTKPTACPGRHAYASISDVNRLSRGAMINGEPVARDDDRAPVSGGAKRKPKKPALLKVRRTFRFRYQTKLWQRVLLSDGENIGAAGVDGKFGDDTRRATRKWQRKRGLHDDGVVGPITWTRALLSDSDGRLRAGDSGARVKLLQLIVRVKQDGKFGPITKAALRKVQRYVGATPDGIVGPGTRGKLIKHWS